MKKSKYNLVADGKQFEKGKLYTAEEVAHLDPTDFEDVADEQKVGDTAPENTNQVAPDVIE